MAERYVSEALLKEADAVGDRVSESDRAYFRRNRARGYRWRPYVEGEDAYQTRFAEGRDPTHTLVVRVTGRVRARTFYRGDVFERVDEEAAHVWLRARAREAVDALKSGRLEPVFGLK